MAEILIGNVKGPQGIPGETGATGAPGAAGADGAAATVNVGTVSTVAYGTPASVTNSGTEAAAVLDFVIPQGKPGEETTRMSGLTLDQITAQSASLPVPAVGESGSVIWGKVVKFFNDVKTSLATKLSGSDCVTVLTSTDTQKPLAASAGKALNDAIGTTNANVTSLRTTFAGTKFNCSFSNGIGATSISSSRNLIPIRCTDAGSYRVAARVTGSGTWSIWLLNDNGTVASVSGTHEILAIVYG